MSPERTNSALEEELGMVYYSTCGRGTGGLLRQRAEDFVVEEITKEGVITNAEPGTVKRGEGHYTLAVLTKTSRDLLPTLNAIGKSLKAQVGFAGIKDRRAVTSQLISLDRPLTQEDMPQDLKNVRLRVVGTSRWGIMPGELRGNRFSITIRGLHGVGNGDLDVPAWLPGYFGHQRFGTTRPNTHKVGRRLVKGDFEGAAREFLAEPYKDEPLQIRSARLQLLNDWDLERSYKDFPFSLIYERAVMKKLLSNPFDCAGAMLSLPKSLLRLFVNAYQSYLFNHALSWRWAHRGLTEVMESDYVAPLDRWGSPSRPIRTDGSNLGALRRMVSNQRAVPMLPVLGTKTRLVGANLEAYDEILESEGISQSDLGRVPGMPFLGTMRFAIFRAISYSVEGPQADELNIGKDKAVVITSLPRSCYATVLLREIMRPREPFAAGF